MGFKARMDAPLPVLFSHLREMILRVNSGQARARTSFQSHAERKIIKSSTYCNLNLCLQSVCRAAHAPAYTKERL